MKTIRIATMMGCLCLSISAFAQTQLESAAAAGDVQSQLWLGQRYLTGSGVPKNDNLAIKWLMRAAEGGNAEAQRLVGQMFAEGRGVEPDAKEARFWYEMAAKNGDSEAIARLSRPSLPGQTLPAQSPGRDSVDLALGAASPPPAAAPVTPSPAVTPITAPQPIVTTTAQPIVAPATPYPVSPSPARESVLSAASSGRPTGSAPNAPTLAVAETAPATTVQLQNAFNPPLAPTEGQTKSPERAAKTGKKSKGKVSQPTVASAEPTITAVEPAPTQTTGWATTPPVSPAKRESLIPIGKSQPERGMEIVLEPVPPATVSGSMGTQPIVMGAIAPSATPPIPSASSAADRGFETTLRQALDGVPEAQVALADHYASIADYVEAYKWLSVAAQSRRAWPEIKRIGGQIRPLMTQQQIDEALVRAQAIKADMTINRRRD